MGASAEKLQIMDSESFEYLRSRLYDVAGINLADSKKDLLVGRLRKRLGDLGFSDCREYVEYLKSLPDKHAEWQVFINNLTTNKTDFFREKQHFSFLLNEVIPKFKQSNSGPMRIWSAASSTGEEPYTLAMILYMLSKTDGFKYTISASDIDTQVLAYAKNGVYQKSRLIELPEAYRNEAFLFGSDGLEGWVKVKPIIKEKVNFSQCNLVSPPYPWEHPFDVIFCRNVLIYFSPATVSEVIDSLYKVARPGAYLFVGHSESLHNVKTRWDYVQPSIYRKKK